MKIEKIYIGGWFQRTMLHLTEIYDFFREGTSRLPLDKKKLKHLRENLDIREFDYSVDGFEYIKYTTNSGIGVKIYEDGLMVLDDEETDSVSMISDVKNLAKYYDEKFSPAISYIFSLGAPVPKELANIQSVFPYFIVLNNATHEEIDELINKTDKQKYYRFSNENFDIVRGDKYYFINNKKKKLEHVERYIEEQIFMREFKGQLHRYLHLHRTIWEKIDEVKEKTKVKGKNIMEFHDKLEGYSKTINLVESRINQMNTYLKTREKIAKKDNDLNEFLTVMEYRYETLDDTLAYIKHIWTMTKNYVNSAMKLFNDLQSEITQKNISDLTVVTSMGVGASLLDLFSETSLPTVTLPGLYYFAILALIGYGVKAIMNFISENRKYSVTDIEYDKDIK